VIIYHYPAAFSSKGSCRKGQITFEILKKNERLSLSRRIADGNKEQSQVLNRPDSRGGGKEKFVFSLFPVYIVKAEEHLTFI
jgi:hypothetical protein